MEAAPFYADSANTDVALAQREALLRDLQATLAQERARFRQDRQAERVEIEEQIRAIALARDEIEQHETELADERQRLVQLRQRFLKRYKKQWTTERDRLAKIASSQEADRSAVERKRLSLEAEQFAFETRCYQETQRIFADRQLLEAEKLRFQQEQCQRDEAFDAGVRTFEQERAKFHEERAQFHQEQQQIQHRLARLRVEADGLESRVLNTRAILLQLEQTRRSIQLPASVSSRQDLDARAPQRLPLSESLSPTPESRILEAIADREAVLNEESIAFEAAKATWLVQQRDLLAEVEGLVRELRDQESDLVARQRLLTRHEARLRDERRELQRNRGQWEAQFALQKSTLLGEAATAAQTRSALTAQAKQLERKQLALQELCRRWGLRRRAELEKLHREYADCRELQKLWGEAAAAAQREQQAMFRQRRELAAGTVCLEQARQEWVESTDYPYLAKRQLDRLERRHAKTFAKETQNLQDLRAALAEERQYLEGFFDQHVARRLDAVSDLQEFELRIESTDLLQQRLQEQTGLLSNLEKVSQEERAIADELLAEFRAEIDRLTAFLENEGYPIIPRALAA